MSHTVLILGASGRFGRHAARAFTQAGWKVRRFDRSGDDLVAAVTGADVVVSAWNPPGYHLWTEDLLAQHAAVAKAAARAGATVILPGNVYVYGPEAPSPWRADTPHLAQNPLGLFRKRIEAAYRDSGAVTIVLRCGDFIDTEKTGNWFEGHISPGVPKGFIRYPGDPRAPHAWAFLPDAARAAVALAEIRASLTGFNDVPFEGYTLSGRDMARAIARITGRAIEVRSFQWAMFRLVKPFIPMLAGLFEMRYLGSLPQRLDGSRLAELVPDFVPTPVEEALRQSLTHQERAQAA
jgi:nucleoside-diphosphate-sugar epimerase